MGSAALKACCGREAEDKEKEEEVMRFFMVGMGSAGKSTVIRQLKKLCVDFPNYYQMYDADWREQTSVHTDGDLRRWKLVIQLNIIEAFCKTIKQCNLFGLKFSDASQRDTAAEIERRCGDVRSLYARKEEWAGAYTEQLAVRLAAMLANEHDPMRRGLSRCHEFSAELRLSDGVDHFLTPQKIIEYSREDTLPSTEDIVYARDPTTGLHDFYFRVHRMKIQIHDMGGQVSERKKVLDFIMHWISETKPNYCYRNFILYVVSMADYNVPHPERPQFTLLDESAAFMKMILNLSLVHTCGFLIFFNKSDVFDQKTSDMNLRHDVRKYLSDFIKDNDLRKYEQGQPLKHDVLRQAIAAKFVKAINEIVVKRRGPVFNRFTCAVDSKMMESLFATIRTDILYEIVEGQKWL